MTDPESLSLHISEIPEAKSSRSIERLSVEISGFPPRHLSPSIVSCAKPSMLVPTLASRQAQGTINFWGELLHILAAF